MKLPFDVQLKAAGLPQPVREFKFATNPTEWTVKDGKWIQKKRKWAFDFAWPEHMIAMEKDGGIWTRGRHVNPRGYLGDLEKLGCAFALGWDVLRVSPEQLDNGTAVRWLKARMR